MLRWSITADTVMVVVVLILKIAVTGEVARLLCRHMVRTRRLALYGCGLLLGFVAWLIVHNFAQQGNLAHPIVWYTKRSLQVVMAVFASTVVAFQWKYHPSGNANLRRHGLLLTALWWDYVGGLLAPRNLQQWEYFGSLFYAPAIAIMLLWILAVRANSSARRRYPSHPRALA